ncbi:golgin subfamily A member 4 [Drosophila tropicalis]|uniref:golgin subfamily A member 4 n=1 Tax=Drosophila tropicalis TaxID=46794 RepID=UPI0035AB8FEF
MFANLKNKLIEEVKASPSKFQQFANAAQAAVSSSSSSTPNSSDTNTNTSATNENFFSITEEDTPQNSPYRIQKLPATSASSLRGRSSTQSLNGLGAVPRTRKLSNSSMASDVSFRLPTYDAPAVYHLQSDLDETSSEFDDSASTARLDVITKDQLYDAYKKSLDRYHKYRCRYTDLAKKYKELERDSTKARSVLVETQDKALRRISELREQCTLEQQAKAHLEEALRIEMDDMSCKMQAYQTKLKLLGENPDNIAAALERSGENEKLIDLDETATKANGSQVEEDKTIIQLRQQLEKITDKYEALRKQEEENVLLLAQTKQDIHAELDHKDNELRQLQAKLKQLESERDTQTDEIKSQLKKLQSAKQEADAKLMASEHLLKETVAAKEQQVALLEEKLQAHKLENEQKLQDLSQHNNQLNEMVQRYKEIDIEEQFQHVQNENVKLKERLDALEQKAQDSEKCLEIERETIAALTSEKSAENEQHRLKLEQLQNEMKILNEQHASTESETISNLKAQLESMSSSQQDFSVKEKELKSNIAKLNKLKKQQEQNQAKISEQAAAIEGLQLQSQEKEKEKEDLQARVVSILGEIGTMQTHLQQVQDSHRELEQEKQELESHINNLQQKQQQDIITSTKLEEIQSENTKLAERNCLLEEQTNHLEKQLIEHSDLRLQVQAKQDELSKLQQKIQQVLDEHSKLQNAQELMDHDYRTLQDKCNAYEKENLIAQDKLESQNVICAELNQTKTNLEKELYENEQNLLELRERHQEQIDQVREQSERIVELEANQAHKETQLHELQLKLDEAKQLQTNHHENQANEQSLRETIQNLQCQLKEAEENVRKTNASDVEKQKQFENLAQQLKDTESNLAELQTAHLEKEQHLREACDSLSQQIKEVKEANVESLAKEAKLQETIENLRQEILKAEAGANLAKKLELEATIQELHQKLSESSQIHDQSLEKESQMQLTIQNLREQLDSLREAEKSVQEKVQATNAAHLSQLSTLQARWSAANGDVERLHEANDALQLEIEQLKNKYSIQIDQLQNELSQRNDNIENSAEISDKLARFEEIQVENEYLNRHTKQLEQELAESVEVKEKLKSLQCELYVLQDKVEEHANQLTDKDKQNEAAKEETKQLKSALEEQTLELSRQQEHASFVTEQNDTVQKELLQVQQQLLEKQAELSKAHEEQQRLQAIIEDASKEPATFKQESSSNTSVPPLNSDADNLRSINDELQRELEELKYKSHGIESNLQQEIDELQSNNKQMAERINELETLRAGIQAQQLMASLAPKTIKQSVVVDEKAELEAKLKEIMNEVQDVTNRNLFLEQKCENFLILEQSNERLRLQNAKLSRQLDETLVSMQHSDSGVPANTEFEYLKNIMFQYLTGNTNNETLVKVISAVLKFSPQQAQVALEKEHQRRSLLNKLI